MNYIKIELLIRLREQDDKSEALGKRKRLLKSIIDVDVIAFSVDEAFLNYVSAI